jgi:hypothetical protein
MIKTTPTARSLQPLLERQMSSWRILRLFAQTPRTESDFAARFDALGPNERSFLIDFYNVETERRAFERICLYWNVRIEKEQI